MQFNLEHVIWIWAAQSLLALAFFAWDIDKFNRSLDIPWRIGDVLMVVLQAINPTAALVILGIVIHDACKR